MKRMTAIVISVLVVMVLILTTGCTFKKINTEELPVNAFVTENEDSIKLPLTVKAGEKIDLSKWYEADGEITWFVWKDRFADVVYPAYEEGGVFVFSDEYVGKKIQCTLKNGNFPEKTSLYTTCVEIVRGDEPVENEISIWERIFIYSPLIPILVVALLLFLIIKN